MARTVVMVEAQALGVVVAGMIEVFGMRALGVVAAVVAAGARTHGVAVLAEIVGVVVVVQASGVVEVKVLVGAVVDGCVTAGVKARGVVVNMAVLVGVVQWCGRSEWSWS